MTNPDPSTVPLERDRCARCAAPGAVLSLLTSMTRYYACRRCDHRWQVSVIDYPRPGTLPVAG